MSNSQTMESSAESGRPKAASKCDSPVLCAANGGCAGRYGTKELCTQTQAGPAAANAPTLEAAYEMGAKGGPVVEAERLAFEAWMRGHCWAVSPTWNGCEYAEPPRPPGAQGVDPLAMATRRLWAVWRDRAALAALEDRGAFHTASTTKP